MIKKGKLFLGFILFTHFTFAQWEKLENVSIVGRTSSIHATSDSIYAAADGGTYSSFDGTSWNSIGNISTTDIIDNDTCLITSSVAGVFYSKYNKIWNTVANGTGLPVGKKCLEIVSNGDKIFVRISPEGDIYSFSSSSGIWTKETIPSGANTLSSNGTDVLVGYSNNIGAYRYDKNQSSWSFMNDFKEKSVNEFFQKGDTVVAVYETIGDSISFSKDNGNSWVKNLMPNPANFISSFQINDKILFAANYNTGTSAEFYISLDYGSNWTPTIIGFTDVLIRDIQIFKGYIYASTENSAAIYRRQLSQLSGIIYNGGGKLEAIKIKDATYQWFFNGLPILNATERTYQALVNGTYKVEITNQKNSAKIMAGAQVISYEYIVSDLTATNVIGSTNKSEMFSATYDPLSQSIHIISEEAIYPTQIEVYNMIGQSLMKNSNEVQNTTFDVSQLHTGTYIVKMNLGGRVHTFKIYKY